MAWEDWYKKEVVGESQGKWEDWYKSNVEEPKKFDNFNKSLGNTLPQQLDRVRVQAPQINIKNSVVNNPSSTPDISGSGEGLLTKGVNVAKNVGKELMGASADSAANFQNLMRELFIRTGLDKREEDTPISRDIKRLEGISQSMNTIDENSGILERAAKGAIRSIPQMLGTAAIGGGLGVGAKALGAGSKLVNAARMTPFAASAFSSGTREAEKQGGSEGQILAKGLTSAAIEVGTEGMDGLMPSYVKKLLSNESTQNGVKDFIKDIGKEMFQEGITEPLYALSDKAIFNKDINMQELGMNTLESALAGGIMGAMVSGADLAKGSISNYQKYNVNSYEDLSKKGFEQVDNSGLWFNKKSGEVFIEKGAYEQVKQEETDNVYIQNGFNPENDIAEVEGLGYVEVLGDLGDSVAIKTADGQQYPIRKSLFDATARVSKASPNLGLPAPVERIQNTNVLPSGSEPINILPQDADINTKKQAYEERINTLVSNPTEQNMNELEILDKEYNNLNTPSQNSQIAPQIDEKAQSNINTQFAPKLTQKQQEAQINMSERTTSNVGSQKVKAYQYLHPEVKPHIQSEAEILLGELQNSQKSESQQIRNKQGTIASGLTLQRETSQSIAAMLDGFTFDTRPGKPGKYEQIEKALQDIIKDNGAENHALAKKIEVIIDDRLSNGYTDFYTGSDIPANEEYKALKSNIEAKKIETSKKVNTKKKTVKKKVKLSAEEKAKKAERDAEEAIAAVKETAKGDNLRSEAGKVDYTKGLLGLSFNRQLIKNGYADLKGQRVTNYKELATIAQVFRDPRFETFRIIYMKGDEIVGHEGITSRIPHIARVTDKDTMEEHTSEIKTAMKKLGADGIYLMHNHPSGVPNPSDADIRMTAKHIESIPEVKGHVIINSNKFATIDREGKAEVQSLGLDKKAEEELTQSLFEKYNVDNDEDLYKVISEEDAEKHLMFQWEDKLLSPEKQHPLLGQIVRGNAYIANLAKSQQLNPNTVVVVYADTKLKIRAIQEVEDITFESIVKAKEYLKPRMSEFGSASAFIVSSDNVSEDIKNTFTALVKKAITIDVVYNSGESYRTKGITPSPLFTDTWFGQDYNYLPTERMSVMENKNPLNEPDIDPYEDFDNGEDKFEDQIRRREAYVKNLIENNSAVEFKNGDYTMTVSPSTKGQKYQATTFYKGEPLSDKNYDTSEEAAKRIVDDGYKEVGQTVMESKKDYNITETDNFKKWFGNSKVVDKAGKPMVVYHGTTSSNNFDVFKPSNAPGWGKGIYFTDNPESVTYYSDGKNGRVLPVYLKLENPYMGKYPGDAKLKETAAYKEIYNKERTKAIKNYEYDPEYDDEFSLDPEELWHEDVDFMNKAIRELGYDGIMEYGSNDIDGYEIVVFNENQIKSATGNNGEFDNDNPSIVMEKGKDYSVVDKTLVALHNISEDKLLKTIELGGFPVPSIAVTKKDIPFEFGGGITLVGNKDLVNPEVNRDNKVFDTDVYSRRIPTEYAEVNYSAKREILAKFKDSFEEAGENKLSVDNAIDTERPDEAFQTLYNKKGTRLQYFKEKGTNIKIPMRKIGPEIITLEFAQDWLKKHPEIKEPSIIKDRAAYRTLMTNLFKDHQKYIYNMAFGDKKTPEEIEKYVENDFKRVADADGLIKGAEATRLKTDIRMSENPREEIDGIALRDLLDKKLSTPKAKADYETWLKDTLAPAFGRHYFYDNNKKKSFDLDNVYDYMSGRIKATESDNMNAGAAKAKGARQFKSIDEMHRFEGSITTTENVDAFKEEFNKSSLALLRALDEYHVTPGSWSNDNSLFSALGDYLGGKTPATALSANGYKKVPKELVNQLVEVAKQLKNAPVNYYEAKPQRIVKFNEFVGAVVPKETPKAVIDKLKEAGIKKVVKYDGSGESRKEAVLKFNNAVFEETSEYGVKQETNGDMTKGNLEKQIESLESQMDLISDDLKAMAEQQLKKYKRLLSEMKAKKITKLSRSQVERLIKLAEIELPKLKTKYQKETEFLKKSANVNMNWRIAEERKKAQERVNKKQEQINRIREQAKARAEKEKAEEAAKKEKAREEKAEREKLNKQKAFLAKVMKRVKYMRPEYQVKVRELLEAIQLTKPTAATIERLEKMKAFFESEENENIIIPDKVKKALERLNKTAFSNLSEEDREAIVTAIQSYVALNDLKNELILNGRRREMRAIIADAVDNLKRRAKKSVFNEKNIDLTSRTEKEKSSILKKIFTVDSYDGETLAQLLDNQIGNVLEGTNGIIHKIFFQGFNDGTTESLKYQYKAIDELVETIKKLDTNIENWSEHFQKKKDKVDILNISLTKGRSIKLTKGQRINIYLNTFNKANLDHMVNGGLSNRENQKEITKVSYEDIKKITESLTPEEKRVAHKMLELLNREEKGDIREGLNRVHTMLNGYPIATVENYWAIKANKIDTKKDPSKTFSAWIKETLEGMGSLKERTNSKNAVVIDDAFELFYESVKKSSAYIGMANHLRNAKTLLYNKEFTIELERRYGEEYHETLEKMVQDVEANSIDTSNIEKLVLDTLHKVQGSILGLNFFTPLKQPVSYLNILPEMDIKYALKGLAGKVDFDKIAKLSPLLRFRLEGNVDREVGEIGSVGTLRKVYTGKDSAASKMTFLIEAMDKLEIGRVWKAVEAEVKDKTDLEGDEYWNMVARRAEEVIFRHQPSTLPHHRSSIGRSSNAATRLLTTFSTQSNKVYNQIRREFLRYEISNQEAADKALLLKNLGLSVFLAALLLQGVDDFRDWALGRREKEFNDKLTNVFGYMIGNMYFVGPVFQSLTSEYSVQNPASGFLNDSIKTVKGIYTAVEDVVSKEKYVSGENSGEEKWETSVMKALEDTLITIATFKGIPAKNIKNLANAANIGKRSENKVLDEVQSFKDEISKINKQIADKATPSARKAILNNRKKMLESKIRKVYNDNNVDVPKAYMTDAQKKALEAMK